MPHIVLACATKPEWSPLAQKIRIGEKVHLVQTGIGSEQALTTFKNFLAEKDTSDLKVIHFGLSGALTPGLITGDLVVPDSFVSRGGQPILNTMATETKMLLSQAGLKFTGGALFTSPMVLDTPDTKKSAGLEHRALAVDMETYGLAKFCHEMTIPFISLRAIFDPMDWDLSDLGAGMMDEKGNLKATGVGHTLLKNPRLLFKLPRYAQASKLATGKLAEFVLHALDQI